MNYSYGYANFLFRYFRLTGIFFLKVTKSSLFNVSTKSSKPVDKNLKLSKNLMYSYVPDIYFSFVSSIKSIFTLSFSLLPNLWKNRWQSQLLKLWNENGIKLFCSGVTLKKHFWWTGPLYLPVKWQWSPTLSTIISFWQNWQIL